MLHVGQGSTVGGLTLFPVWHDRTSTGTRGYDTSIDGLAVTEAEGGPSVPQLVATNTGAMPVLVLDGQLFEGGWQHRMTTRSSLLAAGTRTVLDVACVEHGRWHGTTRQESRGRRAPSYVRAGFDAAGQEGVWERIEEYGGTSATGSLADRLDQPDEIARRALRRTRPLPGQTGVVVGVAGQPLALEVFDHPQTLAEQLEAIVRAAALDAVGRPTVDTPGRRARRMVERYERTTLQRESDGGPVWLGRATTDDLDVMLLERSSRPVHLRATYRRHPVLAGV
jgi:hypothetical protein